MPVILPYNLSLLQHRYCRISDMLIYALWVYSEMGRNRSNLCILLASIIGKGTKYNLIFIKYYENICLRKQVSCNFNSSELTTINGVEFILLYSFYAYIKINVRCMYPCKCILHRNVTIHTLFCNLFIQLPSILCIIILKINLENRICEYCLKIVLKSTRFD